jgi:hypothetical protein
VVSGHTRFLRLAKTRQKEKVWRERGFYRTRFQIEFGIRDAKQFTGLQSQQTRDRERLDFAFNKSSVGSVSGLAKTEQPQILPNHCYSVTFFYPYTLAMKIFHNRFSDI